VESWAERAAWRVWRREREVESVCRVVVWVIRECARVSGSGEGVESRVEIVARAVREVRPVAGRESLRAVRMGWLGSGDVWGFS
jgi:hypothetical protein